MENKNQKTVKTGVEEPVNRTPELKKELNHILVSECGFWGQKLDVLYEQLDEYKRSGVAKLIAEYLLSEEAKN